MVIASGQIYLRKTNVYPQLVLIVAVNKKEAEILVLGDCYGGPFIARRVYSQDSKIVRVDVNEYSIVSGTELATFTADWSKGSLSSPDEWRERILKLNLTQKTRQMISKLNLSAS